MDFLDAHARGAFGWIVGVRSFLALPFAFVPPSVRSLRERLAMPADDAVFAEAELVGLDEPVRRFFLSSIATGTPLARAARLSMRGSIRLKERWLPFRADEVIAPLEGFVWSAAVAGGIKGFDCFADGDGRMRWKLFGIVPVMTATGPNVSLSAAGRAGGEAVWVPTTLLPRFGVRWSSDGDDLILARFAIGGLELEVLHRIDDAGLVRSITYDRVGDPDGTGEFGLHPFGVEVTEHETFDGVTVPSSGQVGWHHGTDRWEDGLFFRYTISDLELVRA
jgi:hypothetical protein